MSLPDRQYSDQGNVCPIPWPEFRAALEAEYQPPVVAPATRCALLSILNALEQLPIKTEDGNERTISTTSDLTTSLVATYLTTRPSMLSPWTIKGDLSVIRMICNRAEMSFQLRVNPFRIRKLARWVRLTPPQGKKHFSRAEIRAVLDLMKKDAEERQGWSGWRAKRLWALTSVVAYCGLRAREAQTLWVQDVDLASRIIHISARARRKTTASVAPVPIPEAAVPILTNWLGSRLSSPYGFPLPAADKIPWLFPTLDRRAAWLSGGPGSKPVHRLKAVAQRAGVEGMTFLSLRHSWATHAEYWGLGPNMTQRVLRHTSSATQNHYRHADIDNLRDKVSGIEF